MINFILALCLSASSNIYQTCDTGCVVRINSDKKIIVSDIPKRSPESMDYATQLCGMVLKLRKKEFTINIFKPEIARTYTDNSDSTFIQEIGENSVSFYRQKRKSTAQWFGVISAKSCSSKWFVFLDSVEIPAFTEIIGGISFLQH